jgi:hypothetical protein
LKEKLKTFYSAVPGDFRDETEDSKFLNELKACPREEIINSIITLQNSYQKDYEMEAKTAYLLVKLKHDERTNKKKLLLSYPSFEDKDSSKFRKDHLIDMICDVIINDDNDKKFLTDAFELEVDGIMATMLFGVFASEFEKNPENFIRALKVKSKKVKENVYEGVCASIQKDTLTKRLDSIPTNSDIYLNSREMLQFIEQSKVCENAWRNYSKP